ncbi:MAG: hypothetical protein R2861_01845 [Desulfobacterales bacterium]
MSNQIKTTLLLAVMTGVIMWVGKMLGGTTGMMIALILAGGMNFFSYWYSDKIVLKIYKAREATREEASLVYRMVEVWRKPACPCPRSTSFPRTRPMPLPRAATRKTPWWPLPKGSCAP